MQVTTPSRAQTKVTNLAKQLEAAKLKAKAEELARRKGQNSALRKAETRRKILLGAFALDALGQGGVDPSSLVIAGKSLEEWLERDADRMLFNLQAHAEEITDVADDQGTRGAAEQIASVDVTVEMQEMGPDIEGQTSVKRLEGEAGGAEFKLELTPDEAVTAAGEESSDFCSEALAEVDAPVERDLADHAPDLIGMGQADDEETH